MVRGPIMADVTPGCVQDKSHRQLGQAVAGLGRQVGQLVDGGQLDCIGGVVEVVASGQTLRPAGRVVLPGAKTADSQPPARGSSSSGRPCRSCWHTSNRRSSSTPAGKME